MANGWLAGWAFLALLKSAGPKRLPLVTLSRRQLLWAANVRDAWGPTCTCCACVAACPSRLFVSRVLSLSAMLSNGEALSYCRGWTGLDWTLCDVRSGGKAVDLVLLLATLGFLGCHGVI
ncbi:hypothetical protein IWZ03DRAFT_370467 [Phyllosticta citriasiana]|uniref:Secreted protein n=1 Tax=Phyllosticta citriasiana TaxID=595635 RepID=A0ABR1KX17_9PEZI